MLTPASVETEGFLRENVQEFVKLPDQASGSLALSQMWEKAARRMSASGGMIRNQENLASAYRTENCRSFTVAGWMRGPTETLSRKPYGMRPSARHNGALSARFRRLITFLRTSGKHTGRGKTFKYR